MGRPALRLVALALLAGCGRIEFDPRSDAAPSDANDTELLVHLTFDTMVGMTVPDESGHGHDALCGTSGTCPGTVASAQRGVVGVFDGNSDLYNIRSTAALENLPSFTAAIWLRPLQAGNPYKCVTGKIFGAVENSWHLCIDVMTGTVFYFGTGGTNAVTAQGAITAGTWQHVALRLDSSTGVKSLLLNGTVAATGAAGEPAWDAGDITLGGDLDGGTLVAPYYGELDEFRLYRGALGDMAIAALANP